MTALLLRVGGKAKSEFSGGLVATVYALGTTRAEDAGRSRQDVIVPTGSGEPLVLDVDAGRYIVELVLPSGETLTEEVSVEDGEELPVELNTDDEAPEGLGWQRLLGNIRAPTPPVLLEEDLSPSLRFLPGLLTAGLGYGTGSGEIARRLAGAGAVAGRDYFAGPAAGRDHVAGPEYVAGSWPWAAWVADTTVTPGLAPLPAVRWMDTRRDAEGRGLAGPGAWQFLSGRGAHDRLRRVAALDRHRLEPAHHRTDMLVYRYKPRRAATVSVSRRFLVVDDHSSIELAVLPDPWPAQDFRQPAPVEILVQPSAGRTGFSAAVTLRDSVVGSALSYMANGAFPQANTLFTQAREVLISKTANTVRAPLGGYALLATETDRSPKDWHAWISNLRTWFPWLPDGSILYGRLKLAHRNGPDDLEEARLAFREAYERGLPFYSLGVQWLMDGLSLFAPTDPQMRRMLDEVRAVAWRVNFRQPFTTVRVNPD